MTDYSKFTNAEINYVIAKRVMEWIIRDGERDYWYCLPNGERVCISNWNPSTDHNDIATAVRCNGWFDAIRSPQQTTGVGGWIRAMVR